ncbi:MAG: hypothetical protein IPP94_08875 [Ignavibacteria bacterium]|nr:hypothetical protein [Ignavibacteria bacterium]
MRLVEVNVRIGNLVASAETSYTVVNKLSPMTLFFESGLQAQSRTEFRLPLTVLEPLSTISPLSFTVLLRFDSTLLALRSVETAGTITQGGTLQLQRIDAGGCRISITDYIPVLPSGPLFQLVFSAAGTPVDTVTRVVILDAGMQQQCPVTLDARGTTVTLLACSQAYTIGSAETVVASPGGALRVPIRVAPALNAGEAFNAHFSVAYDSALVQFSGVEAARPYETGASLVATRIKGSLIVDVRGRPADSTDVLCWLLFRQNNLRESTTASLRLAALAVTTECAVDAASQDPVLLLDGYCERLLTRSASRPTVSAHPNPFNPSTTLEFSIPSDGDASLRIIDVAGREVALLHRGPIASGRYRLPFDARGLPSGSYRAVLTHAGSTAAHSIMFVK